MTIEEILAGESKNVEFKENLPEKSIKYMKSVVAFANGIGGKIIFGIVDKTREVVGFDKEDVFKKMDSITNAVSDSCEPAIIPNVTLQTVEGKTIIVVEVSEGRQRPYYIKALGRDGGVYVRVAGTTRLADEYMIKELLFEGSNRYYDQALCTGLNITDENIDALCKAMKEQAVKNAHNEEQKASIKDVGRQQLRSWGILIERDGKDYPSNAFAYMNLIEHWGSGIPRIIDKVKDAGLREPEFIGGEVDLRINIYRGQDAPNDFNDLNNANKVPDTTEELPDTTNKVPDSADKVPNTMKKMPDSSDRVPDTTEELPDNEQEQQIYKYVSENGSITTAETVELLEVKHRRARTILMNMVKDGYLRKKGAARSTIYVKNTEGR